MAVLRRRVDDGSSFDRFNDWLIFPFARPDLALRTAHGGCGMNAFYIIAGVVTILLFVYLVLALLKPEWFG
jgi:K+-transporting ATPase KdpF subunit